MNSVCSLRKQLVRITVSVSLAVLFLLQTGCNFGTDFTYGKSADLSVNGTSVFANLLRERGHSVSRKRRLTKRVDNFDTIVWAPDNRRLPPEDVTGWIEQWLGKSNSKVLIYIGRSYDANLQYYQDKFENATTENRGKWQRELAEKVMQERRYDYDWSLPIGTDPLVAYWFEHDDDTTKVDASKVGGPWANGIDSNAIDLNCGRLLKPLEDYNVEESTPVFYMPNEEEDDYYYDYGYQDEEFREDKINVQNLLTVDGKPFAFELSTTANPGRKVIIISNGSFLLNYPLMEQENRKLASKVADEATGDVVFIESDFNWPRIGGNANDPALHWSWVGRAPMSYIVPHFLFWGVLYCFVFFPNFGRPKRIQFHPPKAFRSHVQAVAAILRRSKEKSWARQMVDIWLKRNNK